MECFRLMDLLNHTAVSCTDDAVTDLQALFGFYFSAWRSSVGRGLWASAPSLDVRLLVLGMSGRQTPRTVKNLDYPLYKMRWDHYFLYVRPCSCIHTCGMKVIRIKVI